MSCLLLLFSNWFNNGRRDFFQKLFISPACVTFTSGSPFSSPRRAHLKIKEAPGQVPEPAGSSQWGKKAVAPFQSPHSVTKSKVRHPAKKPHLSHFYPQSASLWAKTKGQNKDLCRDLLWCLFFYSLPSADTKSTPPADCIQLAVTVPLNLSCE